MVKICAGVEIWTPAEILTSRAGTTGRYSTGETPPIKAERPEPSDHLRSSCLRINTIYEDLKESSSARLGGSQQLEILPSPNSKRTPDFSAWILIGAEILEAHQFWWRSNFTRRGNFKSALVLSYIIWRMNFAFAQEFSAANFSLNFKHLSQFSWDAEISCFLNILRGYWYLLFCLILCCKYLCIFSVFIYALCMRQYFWCNCFQP